MRERPANFPFYSSVPFWLCLVFLFTHSTFYSLFAFCRTISIYICSSFLLFCFFLNSVLIGMILTTTMGEESFENREIVDERIDESFFA